MLLAQLRKWHLVFGLVSKAFHGAIAFVARRVFVLDFLVFVFGVVELSGAFFFLDCSLAFLLNRYLLPLKVYEKQRKVEVVEKGTGY